MVALAFKLGLRNGELTTLKWCDVDGDYIHIVRSETKFYELDEKGNSGKLIHDVRELKTEAGYNKYIRRACEKIKILERSMHKIRKTTLTQLVDEGMGLDAVRKFVGQIDKKIIFDAYYFDRTPESVNKAIMEKATNRKCN
jgi:integrase